MKTFLLLIFLFLTTSLYSQDLKVVEPLHHKSAFPTAECPVDNYGNYCAVVDIVLPGVEYRTESDLIVKQENLIGTKRLFVCVTSSSNYLTIYTNDYNPLKIQIGENTLYGRELYEVVINENKIVSSYTIILDKSDLVLGREYYQKHEYKKAFDCFLISAINGSDTAQLYCGIMYANEIGVKRDYNKSYDMYKLASKQGLDIAQWLLGNCYLNCYGVKCSGFYFTKWFSAASNIPVPVTQKHGRGWHGELWSYFSDNYNWYLNKIQHSDYIIKCNFVRLAYESGDEFYKRIYALAHTNIPIAEYELGKCYLEGTRVEKDYDQAFSWLNKSLKHGYLKAEELLNSINK